MDTFLDPRLSQHFGMSVGLDKTDGKSYLLFNRLVFKILAKLELQQVLCVVSIVEII